MFKQNDIVEVLKSSKGYIKRGNHYIQNLTKEIFQNILDNEKLFIDVNNEENPEEENFFKDFFDNIKNNDGNNLEFNVVFSGKMMDISKLVMEKWFVKTLYQNTNHKSRFLINKKLRQIKSFVDNFLTVFEIGGNECVKCALEYTLVMNPDEAQVDILVKPLWYDPTFSYKGNDRFSTYKIFYITAVLYENVFSQPSRFIEHGFMNSRTKEYYTLQAENIKKLLKEFQFSERDIDDIFGGIQGILELSQYYAKGDKKSLEFIGADHLKVAAKKLNVKEQGLHDFIVQEYTWKDNKKRLNSPENINIGICSFISKLYEVILSVILEKINNKNEDPDTSSKEKIHFFYSPSLPLFNKKTVFNYGDFLQYSEVSHFESALVSIIEEKVNTFQKFVKKDISLPTSVKEENPSSSSAMINQIFDILKKCKLEKNKLEYLKKCEKLFGNGIKFSKDKIIYAEIFIEELKMFVKFDWNSFMENSETYSMKQMKAFLKMSSSSFLKRYNINSTLSFFPEKDDLYHNFTLGLPFSINTFIVHSLLDTNLLGDSKQSLSDQISQGNLRYLFIDEICSMSIRLKDFVFDYRMLFLKHNDVSKEWLSASKHAIYLLKLNKAWCCENYIHLRSEHVERLKMMKRNLKKSAAIVQRFLRKVVAQMKLKRLKELAETYKTSYINSTRMITKLSEDFEKCYIDICKVDLEQIDFNILNDLIPSLKEIEDMKNFTFQWLKVFVMSGSTVISEQSFTSSKLSIFYSNNEFISNTNGFDIKPILPPRMNKQNLHPFMMKIEHNISEDVVLTFQSSQNLYLWNVETEINKKTFGKFVLSKGILYPQKEYRLFSMDYIFRKIAYSVINRVPYIFKDLIRECSFALIIERDVIQDKSLSKAPLWMYFVNYYPICNLSSHSFFVQVEKEIRKIDRKECLKFVEGPSIRPKDDWLTEDVYTQLMLISIEKEKEENDVQISSEENRISDLRMSVLSNYEKPWSKINYKLRKYMFKSNN